jgi:hypothetical protein
MFGRSITINLILDYKGILKYLIYIYYFSFSGLIYKSTYGWVPVAHACTPGYSAGRDREDRGSKPAWANSSQDPILKKSIAKKGWWSNLRCKP